MHGRFEYDLLDTNLYYRNIFFMSIPVGCRRTVTGRAYKNHFSGKGLWVICDNVFLHVAWPACKNRLIFLDGPLKRPYYVGKAESKWAPHNSYCTFSLLHLSTKPFLSLFLSTPTPSLLFSSSSTPSPLFLSPSHSGG